RTNLCEPESFRPDLKCGDGAKRLSSRQSAECLFRCRKTLPRCQDRCFCIQHDCSDRIEPGFAVFVALDPTPAIGSTKDLICKAGILPVSVSGQSCRRVCNAYFDVCSSLEGRWPRQPRTAIFRPQHTPRN